MCEHMICSKWKTQKTLMFSMFNITFAMDTIIVMDYECNRATNCKG